MKTKMITAKIKFIHYEWDNYQGASGKVFEREKIIELDDSVTVSELREECRSHLNKAGAVDDWSKRLFTGSGLVSIEFI